LTKLPKFTVNPNTDTSLVNPNMHIGSYLPEEEEDKLNHHTPVNKSQQNHHNHDFPNYPHTIPNAESLLAWENKLKSENKNIKLRK
jgi:hypothetical protein